MTDCGQLLRRLLQSKGRLEHETDGWHQADLEDGCSEIAGLSVAYRDIDVVVQQSKDEVKERHVVERLLWQLCNICSDLGGRSRNK